MTSEAVRAGAWLLAGALAAGSAACASGAASTSPAAPPAEAASHAGRFVWQDLVTRDAVASRRFYEGLLGWEFQETERDGHAYYIARSGGRFVGGIVPAEVPAGRPAVWLGYLAVHDLERAVAKVGAAGGRVIVEPRPVGDLGRVAVVTDPQGAPLGLALVTGEIPDEPAEPLANHFFWTEYQARNAATALSFYKDLAGFESSLTVSARGVDFHVLKTQRPRAGLFQIPADATMVEPNWLPHVRVADPASLAARAATLGGRVLIAPRAEVRNGTLAVIADPTGGALALQKWPL